METQMDQQALLSTRSMRYLQHIQKDLSIRIEYKWLMKNFNSLHEMEQLHEKVQEEIARRNEQNIVNPEGFCDSVENDDIYWTCECETCVRQTEEFNVAAEEWENQNGEEYYDIGNCGGPCDGHCEVCDPGFMERHLYGNYDVLGEI